MTAIAITLDIGVDGVTGRLRGVAMLVCLLPRVGYNGRAGIRSAVLSGLFIIRRLFAGGVSLVGVHFLLEEGT